MTTTETHPADTPEWARRYLRRGTLPPVGDDSAHDVDYIVRRLRDALGRAQARREDIHPEHYAAAAAMELATLRHAVERLANELSAYTPTAEDLVGLLRHQHSQMRWIRHEGGFLGYLHAGTLVDDAARRCAVALRLLEKPGGRWSGALEGFTVTVDGAPRPGYQASRERLGDDVVDALLAVGGAHLPPIEWSRSGTDTIRLYGYTWTADDVETARRWAEALGLGEPADQGNGSAEYYGLTAFGSVRLHFIHDQGLWNRAVAEHSQRRAL